MEALVVRRGGGAAVAAVVAAASRAPCALWSWVEKLVGVARLGGPAGRPRAQHRLDLADTAHRGFDAHAAIPRRWTASASSSKFVIAKPKPHVQGSVYMLQKEFLINLADGRFAKMQIGLVLAHDDTSTVAAGGHETRPRPRATAPWARRASSAT